MDRPKVVTAHVLFIDMVGSSALPIEVFGQRTSELRRIVAETPEVMRESAAGRVQLEDTGDGLAIAFTGDPTSPLECAKELFIRLGQTPGLSIRAGIDSGAALEVDGLEGPKLTGAAFIGAKRVMEACRPGALLVSATYAEMVSGFRKWNDAIGPVKLARLKDAAPLLIREVNLARIAERDASRNPAAESEALFAAPAGEKDLHHAFAASVTRARIAAGVALVALAPLAGIGLQSLLARLTDEHFIEFRQATFSWWRYGGDSTNLGRGSFAPPPMGRLKWSLKLIGRVETAAAVGTDGTIYVGTDAGYFYGISSEGRVRWVTNLASGVESCPALAVDGRICLITEGGEFFILDRQGRILVRTPASGASSSSGTIADGLFIAGTKRGIEAKRPDGGTAWLISTEDKVESSPALERNGALVFQCHNGRLMSVTTAGVLQWSVALGTHTYASAAIGYDGTIYCGAGGGRFFAINQDGSTKWSYLTGIDIGSSPAIARDGTIYVGSFDGNLYAFSPKGRLKWKFRTGDKIYSNPVVTYSGEVVFGSFDHNIYGLSPEGKLKWRIATGDHVLGVPAIGGDGTVYIGSDDGRFYAIH